jgi:hypothetical protein
MRQVNDSPIRSRRGVLTDSDNTGASVDAWYGDIRFAPATR